MRILLLDPFSGLSGDMFLGAFVDLGLPLAELRAGLATLPEHGFSLEAEEVTRAGSRGCRVHVSLDALGGREELSGEAHQAPGSGGRSPAALFEIIHHSGLPAAARVLARQIFSLLAEAEARVHGVALEEVHFHEVGATDALVDVCGAALALHHLGIEKVYSAPVALGSGTLPMAHGELPLPAPATLELLSGFPCRQSGLAGELVTPTGAAILRALEPSFEPAPPCRLLRTGYGAGKRERPGHPNLLRATLGEIVGGAAERDEVLELTFEVDDMSPEALGAFRQKLSQELVLDLSISPCLMKKGRPGQRLTLLLWPEHLPAVEELVFLHTSTFGFRLARRERRLLRRKLLPIETPRGSCRVKLGFLGERLVGVHPEASDVEELARLARLPFAQVAREAAALAWKRFGGQ